MPSNYQICLVSLDKVMRKLEKSGYDEAYCTYWRDQKAADYIEEFECKPEDYSKFNWLTHRPIFKTDEQSTTKIRGVFNCRIPYYNVVCDTHNKARNRSLKSDDVCSSTLRYLIMFKE